MNSLSVAIVGHTNTGKTSLIRTLIRDTEFGEVADQAGTTRHVEGASVNIDQAGSLSLFDTPGLEDSSSLLHLLNEVNAGKPMDGIDRLYSFLENAHYYPDLDQESKVLRSLLNNDLIFYVIDLREDVLGKYRDELSILSYAAKPIIPVLNFIEAGKDNIEQWKTTLARLNFHAYVVFDNIKFNFSDELKIYQKMQTMLADKEALLDALIQQRRVQWEMTFESAKKMVADMFINCASARFKVINEEDAIQEGTLILQNKIREIETKCVIKLLKLYQFRASDLTDNNLDIVGGEWELDLFSLDSLKDFGVSSGGYIAKGAGAGVVVDLAVGGITLGAAAVTGGVLGALWSVTERYYDEIEASVKGARYICLNEETLQVLWFRQSHLLQILQKRGHASFEKIDYQSKEGAQHALPKKWSYFLRKCRSHPKYSSINNKKFDKKSEKRLILQDKICADL